MEYKLPKDYKKPDKFRQVEFDQFNHELYNSPITLVQSAIKTQIEDGVLKTVQEVGFDVDPKELYQVLICSNCNAAFKTSKGLIYPFCPYCGAKMMRRKTNENH